MFLVTEVNFNIPLSWEGNSMDVELVWAAGQIGACPVFATYTEAYEAAGGDENLILELVMEATPCD